MTLYGYNSKCECNYYRENDDGTYSVVIGDECASDFVPGTFVMLDNRPSVVKAVVYDGSDHYVVYMKED